MPTRGITTEELATIEEGLPALMSKPYATFFLSSVIASFEAGHILYKAFEDADLQLAKSRSALADFFIRYGITESVEDEGTGQDHAKRVRLRASRRAVMKDGIGYPARFLPHPDGDCPVLLGYDTANYRTLVDVSRRRGLSFLAPDVGVEELFLTDSSLDDLMDTGNVFSAFSYHFRVEQFGAAALAVTVGCSAPSVQTQRIKNELLLSEDLIKEPLSASGLEAAHTLLAYYDSRIAEYASGMGL